MTAEIGLALLWLAASLALLQIVMGGLALRDDRASLISLVKPAAALQGIFTLGAFFALILLFATTDLSVLLVARDSHSLKPLLYKVAGAWGNHEGSMLLWVTILSTAAAGIALLERRLDARTHLGALVAQAILSLGFYAFLLFSSNPFTRIDPPAQEGRGLNPLLQDPGLAFHPPTLYFGYVGLSVAFSFAVGALLARNVGPAFARAMRPWVLGAWTFLTVGIAAGSYWAYYELGWGGWWFWDPVENASLVPWLAATALLHSVNVTASRDALRAWTVMLAVVAFSMSMVGTFIVRSGLLTSVHAFAVDPARGTFILALLIIYIGGALTLFGLRIGTVNEGKTFALVSREGGLVINNLLLTAILAITLIGTLYPMVAEAMGARISVGPPYFNRAAGPVALLLVTLMPVGPLLRWRQSDWRPVARRLRWPLLIAAATLAMTILLAPGITLLPRIALTLAPAVALASLMPLRGRRLVRTPLPVWGMVLAHLGIAVAMFGMASESAFTSERLIALPVGGKTDVAGWTVRFVEVAPVAGPNWTAVEGRLIATRRSGAPFVLNPQTRTFIQPATETNEAFLLTRPDGQLYAVLGQRDEQGRYQLRLWWKPMVLLIWAGGGLIALGGLFALIGRLGIKQAWRAIWRRRGWGRAA